MNSAVKDNKVIAPLDGTHASIVYGYVVVGFVVFGFVAHGSDTTKGTFTVGLSTVLEIA